MQEVQTLIATYSTDSLTHIDIQVLCAALNVPTPTPDVTLDTCLRTKGLTPEAAFHALRNSTDVKVMIAAAALRGKVTRLAPDPRLNPRPLPPLKPAQTAGDGATPPVKRTGRTRVPLTDATDAYDALRVSYVASPNPKKPDSLRYARYELYQVGLTVAELKAKGLRARDVEGDVERGFVRLSPPEDTP
jgi:hypothetical protein